MCWSAFAYEQQASACETASSVVKRKNQHLGLSLLLYLLLPSAEGINEDPRSWMISFALADRKGSQETGA